MFYKDNSETKDDLQRVIKELKNFKRQLSMITSVSKTKVITIIGKISLKSKIVVNNYITGQINLHTSQHRDISVR